MVVEEWQKPEAPRKKQEVTRVAAPKIEESAVAKGNAGAEDQEKESRLEFESVPSQTAEPEVNAVPPPPQKPEPTPRRKRQPRKTEPAPEAPKKEEAPPKKEEVKKKKKSRWGALNPLNWNPFKHKSTEPEPER